MEKTAHQWLRSSGPIDESTQESLFLDAIGDVLKAHSECVLHVGKTHAEVGGDDTDDKVAFLAWIDENLPSVAPDAEAHRTVFELDGTDGSQCVVVVNTLVVSE